MSDQIRARWDKLQRYFRALKGDYREEFFAIPSAVLQDTPTQYQTELRRFQLHLGWGISWADNKIRSAEMQPELDLKELQALRKLHRELFETRKMVVETLYPTPRARPRQRRKVGKKD